MRGVIEDPLPGMPQPGAKKVRTMKEEAADAKVHWRSYRLKNPLKCSTCTDEIAAGTRTRAPWYVAWKRIEGDQTALYCQYHAQALKDAEEAARIATEGKGRG